MIRLALLSVLLVTSSSVEKGSLRLTSQPGVEVEWEGIHLGETDADGILVVGDIPPGDYAVSLSKPGYFPRQSRLTISGGETAVTLGLERRAPPPPPRQRTVATQMLQPPEPEREREGFEDPKPVVTDEPVAELALPPRAITESAPDSPAPGPRSSSAAFGWLLLIAALSLSAALVMALGRARRREAVSKRKRPRHRSARKPLPAGPSSSDEAPGFLKDLQHREENFDFDDREIIDVIDVEILEEEP